MASLRLEGFICLIHLLLHQVGDITFTSIFYAKCKYKAGKAPNSAHLIRIWWSSMWRSRKGDTCLTGVHSSGLSLASQLVLQVSDFGFQQLDHLLVVLLGTAGLPLSHIGLSSLQTTLEPDVLLHRHAGLLGRTDMRSGVNLRVALLHIATGRNTHFRCLLQLLLQSFLAVLHVCQHHLPQAGEKHTPMISTVVFQNTINFVWIQPLYWKSDSHIKYCPKYSYIDKYYFCWTFPGWWPYYSYRYLCI